MAVGWLDQALRRGPVRSRPDRPGRRGQSSEARDLLPPYAALSQTGNNAPMTTRVLVVDDDPAVRSAVSRALRVDYDVDEAADGAEALARHASSPADAIVLDLLMPEIGGLDVCRSLRRRGDAVPVLVVTARDAVSDRVEGLDAGADDYLVKPFAVEELRARVRALLRRTGAGDGVLRVRRRRRSTRRRARPTAASAGCS